MSTRRWAMSRYTAGVYLWPSDDLETVWLLNRYTEDGSSDVYPAGSRWWACQQMPMAEAERAAADPNEYDDPTGWSGWDMYSYGHRTRAAALADAEMVEAQKQRDHIEHDQTGDTDR